MDKQHILNEIKRTAEANGGVPLGHRRFFLETGIRNSDWRGKLWARWGDALREAGFEPNRMQSAYNEAVLIEKLIALTRELGHFPTVDELRLKARREPGFPNDKTFLRLAGSKRQLSAKVRDYCEGHEEYADVLNLCPIASDIPPAALSNGAGCEEGFGFVYLIRSGRYYKIGCSNSAGRREYELAIQLPEKATLVHTIRTDDAAGIEAYWHKRFAPKRKGGEWFELSADDVRAFKRRKFM